MQDIDLTESPYTGFCNKYAGDFAGTFDGNHKSLINLNGCVFDEVTKDGTVKDLYIVNANKKYGKKYSKCAALADDNYGEIQNCAVIDSEYAVENNLADSGLLVGFNKGVISKCKVENCTIDAHGANIGGIVGRNDGTVSECYSKVSISGANNTVGGIAGANFGIIEECYSDPEELTGYSKYCGGIAGVSKSKSFIKDCVSMFIPEEPEKLLGSAGPFIGSIVGGDDGYTAEYNIGAVTDEPEEPDEDDKSAVRDYEKLLEYWPKHHGEAPSGDEEMKDPIKTKIATKVKNVTGMKGLHFTVSKDVKYETKKYNKAFKVTEKKLVKTAKK